MPKATALLLLLALSAFAEPRIQPGTIASSLPINLRGSGMTETPAAPAIFQDSEKWRRMNVVSGVFAISGQVADYASNPYGGTEVNPLLATNGHMKAKGTAIKAGIVGGYFLIRYLVLRKPTKVKRAFFFGGDIALGAGGFLAAGQNWSQR